MAAVALLADELEDDHAITESHRAPNVPQAIQQERLPSSESDVGRIGARLRDKGKDYGEFWGARATGSSDRYNEFTWFIRWAYLASDSVITVIKGYRRMHEELFAVTHASFLCEEDRPWRSLIVHELSSPAEAELETHSSLAATIGAVRS